MRFQVPQFVDIEDKIIGPLTLKQFSFYLVAILLLAPIYVLADLGLLITLAIPTLGVAALFAHGKFYGQSFGQISLNAISYLTSERLLLWRRAAGAKNLRVTGAEYAAFLETERFETPSLTSVAQELNTEGNIVGADAADPLLEMGEERATAAGQARGGKTDESGEAGAANSRERGATFNS